jgi:hypothetical protein
MTSFDRAGRRVAAFVLALAAGLAPAVALAGGYPARVADFGEFDHFPATVGPYVRGHVTAYAPALADFSIGYDARSFSLANAVTLYFYPRRHASVDEQLQDEEQQVLRAHEGARVTARRSVTLARDGASREARLVSFAFDGDFAGQAQPLASQLLLVMREHGVFMVRSTAPAAQGALAEHAMLDLVQRVDWDSVPDR